jgi:hypothetical protein
MGNMGTDGTFPNHLPETLAELELRLSEARKTLRLSRAASGERHSFDSSLESV